MSPQEITQLLANWGKVRSDGVVRGRLRAGVDSLSRVGSIWFLHITRWRTALSRRLAGRLINYEYAITPVYAEVPGDRGTGVLRRKSLRVRNCRIR